MIINEIEKTKSTFKPIKIPFTIEEKDELYELWHRLNINMVALEENAKNKDYVPVPKNQTKGLYDLWNILDDYIEEHLLQNKEK